MRNFPGSITDPVYKEPVSYNWYHRFWLKHINDKRDLPFVDLLTIIHLAIIPVGILLFTPLLPGWWWWGTAVVYFYFSQFYLKGSFGLMLHCLCHRKTFKASNSFTRYIHWFVCPFFGHLGDSYFIHHMAMHHVAGNMPDDASSTMGYQRDKPSDFIRYWLRFMFLGAVDVIHYLFGRKKKKLRRRLRVSEIGFVVIATGLCFVNLKAAMAVFVIPFLFARLVMMIGNWAQHAFVDPELPDNELCSTYICINTGYNHKCWNDGYHALHHLRPGLHYLEYPVVFNQMLPDLAEHRTFVFENIHYLHIFSWLMAKRYDKLADHMINIHGTFSSREEAIALLKARTQKFDLEKFSDS
jgi:fatty acid desaturase